MKHYSGISKCVEAIRNSVVTIGNFDGVHIGHQEILKKTVAKAKGIGGVSVAYTFRPHPRLALKPDHGIDLLTTYDEKLAILSSLGLDVVIEEPFSREFSTIDPAEFIRDYLVTRLNAAAITVGYDFGFGRGREGHLELLQKLCEENQIDLTVVQPFRLEHGVVSSSRVRQLLLSGEIEPASTLLGRHFAYSGIVVKGDGRGRTLGFPTANLECDPKLMLPYGVYAAWVDAGEGSSMWSYPSVANIGVRPTFKATHPSGVSLVQVEAHLIDQTIDLYGTRLKLRFVKRLRGEQKFDSVKALTSQIERDIEHARQVLAS